jgi:hypothetical protein
MGLLRWHCNGMDSAHSMDKNFLIFSAILFWNLNRPPWLQSEMWIRDSPITVPTETTASPQARKEIRSGCKSEISTYQNSRGSRMIRLSG